MTRLIPDLSPAFIGAFGLPAPSCLDNVIDSLSRTCDYFHMICERNKWTDESVPYICWDRSWTVREIRERLARAEGVERHRLIAWLMRELKTTEVWYFLKPADVYREFDAIKRWLGPSTELWTYLLGIWHELGKV